MQLRRSEPDLRRFSTSLDNLSSFSNFGPSSVDLAAPGGTPGTAVNSAFLYEPMSQTFSEAPLDPNWVTGGAPDTWDRTDEPSELPGSTLTDSPGAGHGNNTDNFARFGPVNLSGSQAATSATTSTSTCRTPTIGCGYRSRSDNLTYVTVDVWSGAGKSSLTPFITASPTRPRPTSASSSTQTPTDQAPTAYTWTTCASAAPRPATATSRGPRWPRPTSRAPPHLLLDHNPAATVAELREWLLDGVDLKASLEEESRRTGG